MATREKGGRVVFIGNIPYNVSEEQICDIFGRVGTVVSFRLVYDKETGRPKGFGFLEYTDADAAASAVRNLNDFEAMGRNLRVDYSNDNGGGAGGKEMGATGAGRAPLPAGFDMGGPPTADPAALPPLLAGTALPPGLTAPDAISRTLQSIPAPQLLDILSQMKNLTTTNPVQAQALLTQAPQLGYAIFQALMLLGLVDASVLGTLIQGGAPPPPPPQQQQFAPPPPVQQVYAQPPPPVQQYAPTPSQPAYQAPPPQQQQTAMPALSPDQQAIYQQVMALTAQQIYAMPEASRGQILALRQSWGMPALM